MVRTFIEHNESDIMLDAFKITEDAEEPVQVGVVILILHILWCQQSARQSSWLLINAPKIVAIIIFIVLLILFYWVEMEADWGYVTCWGHTEVNKTKTKKHFSNLQILDLNPTTLFLEAIVKNKLNRKKKKKQTQKQTHKQKTLQLTY